MFRVATPELGANGRVTSGPETGEIFGHLNGTVVRGKYLNDDRHLSLTDRGGIFKAEKMLDKDGDAGLLVAAIVDTGAFAGGKSN